MRILMALNGKASFQGAAFELDGDFGETYEERLNRIVQVLPTNVVGYSQDDLNSPKIRPLLYDCFKNETNERLKHHQALLLFSRGRMDGKSKLKTILVQLRKTRNTYTTQ